MSELEDGTEKLQAALARLQDEASRLECDLSEKRRDLRKVKRALAELTSNGAAAAGITKKEVLGHLEAIRSGQPGASTEELRQAVVKRLVAEGRSTTGLGLLFPRAMKTLNATK